MPDFSPQCQAARDAYQAATEAYRAARDAHLASQAAARRALDALNQAQQRLNDAQAALAQAEADWDAHTNGVRAAPALGVAGVEAGVQPPQAPPAGAAVAGLFFTRVAPNFHIWALGDAAPRSAWLAAADASMQQGNRLKAAAEQAQARLAQATAAHADAVRAEAGARAAEQAAADARTQASAAASAALAQIAAACAGETASQPFGDDGEFQVDPGVLPEDEEKVRERLESLPEEETEGLEEIELQEELGSQSEDGGIVAGQYTVGSQTVELFLGGHNERVLKHEVGHHVYYHRMDDAARERWDRFYAQGSHSQQVPAGKMPTGYAATAAREGFAEVYEYYRDGLPLDPEVRQLIEELLAGLD